MEERMTESDDNPGEPLARRIGRREVISGAARLGAALAVPGAFAVGTAEAADQPAELAPIIAAAKQEGAVVGAGNQLQSEEVRLALADGFRAYYGFPSSFKVDLLVKGIGPQQKQVEDELAAGRVSTDVLYMNFSAWAASLAKRGKAIAFDAPTYQGYTRWEGQPGFNNRPYYVSDPSFLVSITWNTEVIKGNEFKSWSDLLRPEYKGKIQCQAARLTPSLALSYKGMRETPAIGDAFFEKLAQLDIVAVPLSQTQASNVVSGDYPIAMGAASRPYAFWKRGARNIAQSFPREGVVVLPDIWLGLADGPHPNAAKLLLNFARSREGQQIIADYEGLWSGRDDVKSPQSEFVPNPADVKLIFFDQVDVTPDEMRRLGEDWRNLFGM
jgi:iron(III) transport system substrate-binding protein